MRCPWHDKAAAASSNGRNTVAQTITHPCISKHKEARWNPTWPAEMPAADATASVLEPRSAAPVTGVIRVSLEGKSPPFQLIQPGPNEYWLKPLGQLLPYTSCAGVEWRCVAGEHTPRPTWACPQSPGGEHGACPHLPGGEHNPKASRSALQVEDCCGQLCRRTPPQPHLQGLQIPEDGAAPSPTLFFLQKTIV